MTNMDSYKFLGIQFFLFIVNQVRKGLAQQKNKTLSNLEETAPIDIIEEGEGVLDIEEGMYRVSHIELDFLNWL